MRKEDILGELEEVAQQLGYRIRYEKGDFAGGDCRVREDRILVVNKFVPIESKVSTIARTLSRFDTSQIYITPQVRKLIEGETDRPVQHKQNASVLKPVEAAAQNPESETAS